MALGVVARLVVAAARTGPARFRFEDSASYLAVAGSLPSGLWSPAAAVASATLARTPAYPSFIWLTGGTHGDGWTVVAQCVLGGAINVWLVHRLATRAVGIRAATTAAFVCALDPASVRQASLIATETLAATGVVLVLLGAQACRGAIRAHRPPWIAAAGTGAAAGLVALTRPNLVVLVVVGAALVAAAAPLRRTLGPAALVLAVALGAAAGWTARNDHVGHEAVLSTIGGQNLTDFGLAAVAAERGSLRWSDLDRSQLNLEINRLARTEGLSPPVDGDTFSGATDRRWRAEGLTLLRHHPAGVATVAGQGTVRALAAPGVADGPGRVVAVGWLLAVEAAAAAGAAVLVRRRRWWDLALLAGTALTVLLASVGPWMDVRFRVPIVPMLAVLAGLGATVAVDHLCRKLCIGRPNLGRTEKVRGQPWGLRKSP